MSQRQFSITDSDVWLDKYGLGNGGVYHPPQGTVQDVLVTNAVTGTASATTLTGTSTGLVNGDLLLIWQGTGTGVGNWELNKVSNTTGFALSYKLMNTYASGAQAIKLTSYSSATIDNGTSISGQAFNGTTGGIYVLLVNGNLNINGPLNLVGGGFTGGINPGGAGTIGNQGNSELGSGTQSNTNNGSAGGGGNVGRNYPWSAGASGGGGAGVANGGNGFWNGGANIATNGTGGTSTYSTGALIMGGSGGAGGNDDAQFGNLGVAGGTGGNGSMAFLIIAQYITFGTTGGIDMNGSLGQPPANINGQSSAGVGGSGGSGTGIFKCVSSSLGNNLITAVGGTSQGNPTSTYQMGGNGGNGAINVFYGGTAPKGITSPGIIATQDSVLLNNDPMMFFGSAL